MSAIIEAIQAFLLAVFKLPEIVVALIAMVPIVEVRLAIPIAVGYGLNYFAAWSLSFIGSSLAAVILLPILIPFIKWLAKTRLFRKVGGAILAKFESKAAGIENSNADKPGENMPNRGKKESSGAFKKMLGTFIFVAIPLPLTGVWTGCAVASIIGLKFWQGLVSVVGGNLVASLIILLLSVFFEPYIDLVIAVIGVIAIVVVIVLLVKIFLFKPTEKNESNVTSVPKDE